MSNMFFSSFKMSPRKEYILETTRRHKSWKTSDRDLFEAKIGQDWENCLFSTHPSMIAQNAINWPQGETGKSRIHSVQQLNVADWEMGSWKWEEWVKWGEIEAQGGRRGGGKRGRKPGREDEDWDLGGRMRIFPRQAPPAGGPGALLMTPPITGCPN